MTDASRERISADALDVETRPRTVAQLPFFVSGRHPRPDLIGQCRDGRVEYTSGRDLLPTIRDLSLGLATLGMASGDRVAILSESRPEWLFADLAVLAGGGVTTPIYPTLSAEQIAFILEDCGASIVIVSTAVQLEKVRAVVGRVPALSVVVLIEGEPPASVDTLQITSFAAVAALGHDRMRAGWGVAREFHDAARRVRPDDLATIIYTSGTTGDPKGVMLTHANLIANIDGVLQALDLTDADVALSFLPLCHSFERIVAYIYLTVGISVSFAESIDTISRDLQVVRPTVMSGVPRVFEKLRARIVERANEAPAPRRAVFRWASRLARRRGYALVSGRPLPLGLRVQAAIADRLVYEKIRAAVGGRLRYAVSGSAPLDADLAAFFFGAGLPILEGYGLTETAPVLCVMSLDRVRFGTVGPPLANVDLRIADDGEILARGPNVMQGYYHRPDETAAALADGWFHTGDIGELDEAGFLRITDRKKELLVTSGGKKVAPQHIEQRLRQQPFVVEAVLVGDGRHFPAAMIQPDIRALAAHWGVSDEEARARATSGEARALLQAAVDAANDGLAQFERVKKFDVFTDEATIDNGLLTPTLKVKRRVFEQRYRAQIDAMYS